MSGPRRHGLRRLAAIACFLLLALSFALLRESGASASAPARAAANDRSSTGLLGGLGGVVQGLGHTVNGLLNGVGGLLGAPTRPPHSKPSTTPPSSTPPRTSPSAPVSSTPTTPTSPPRHHRATRGTHHPVLTSAVGTQRHARSAAPLAATVGRPTHARTSAASSLPNVPVALNPSDAGVPGLDVTAALAAVTIAMVLGVGLIVYRAGRREERAH